MDPDELITMVLEGVGAALGSALLGVHVVGERALGAMDVVEPLELVVVTSDRVDVGARAALEGWHTHLASRLGPLTPSCLQVDVVYAPAADLRSPMTVGRAWPRADPRSGELVSSSAANTLRARWVLRERGLTVHGESADVRVAPVEAGALRAEMIGLARTLAEGVETDPARLDDEARVQELVASLCGALHTVHTDEVTHRAAARAWTLTALPAGPDQVVRAVLGSAAPDAATVRAFAWEMHRLVGAEALRRRDR